MNANKTSDLHIGIISDIILAPYFFLSMELVFGKNVRIYYIPYGEQNSKSYQEQLLKSDVIIVWLNFATEISELLNISYSQVMTEQQSVDEIFSICERLYFDLRMYKKAFVFWLLFEDCFNKLPLVSGHTYNTFVDKINIKLSETIKEGVLFIDLKHLIAQIGITNAYDKKSQYRWNAPYSKSLVELVTCEIYKQYLIQCGITKKCLVLDCDNVLWGGILSEDGRENIKLDRNGLGRPYQDFQRFVLSLYYHGVILAICSKNDFYEVKSIFLEHNEMILKMEHIACFKVNWENKSDNIKQIAEKLNISLDSIVFVDDSPFEIEEINALLPEVTSILYERDTVYDKLSCFNVKYNMDVDNIKKRNYTYITNQFREELKADCKSHDEYIESLNIKLEIHEASPIEFARIAEITQRTNKCTNGIRYTVMDIKEHLKTDKCKMYVFYLADRFSDLGLVGAVEVKNNTLTLFSLSCRALGRNIEKSICDFIYNNHQIQKIEFQNTGKNEEIKTFLQSYFFH